MNRSHLPVLLAMLFTGVTASAQNTESALRPGDSIIVKISGVPTEEINVVSNTYDIADNGSINLPYIGQVQATGMRPSALQRSIESAYKSADIFTHPTVQVTPNREAATQVVYVSGEVKAPGRIGMTPGMSVHDTITSAAGPTDFANMKKVKLTRNGQTRELDLRRADGPDAALPAQPGDKIHVSQ
jgi:protein involved in polysaccharide export with SLBB domain